MIAKHDINGLQKQNKIYNYDERNLIYLCERKKD